MEEEKNTNNEITILFGAGAEKDLGMPIGEDFAKKVLGLPYKNNEMKAEIDAFYKNQLNNISSECKKAWYPQYNKYSHYIEDSLLKACLKKSKLENNEDFNEDKMKKLVI